jgi:hypothetical protein
MTHNELNALIGVLKRHITSFWPCKRRSNLDARVVKRLTGQDKFVDFESSDPAARGMLISYKELLFASTVTADPTWNKWVIQEREMTWRALVLASRGLHSWGAVLYSQLHELLQERTPGTSLMMLKAVRSESCAAPISVRKSVSRTSRWINRSVKCLGLLTVFTCWFAAFWCPVWCSDCSSLHP